MKLLFIFLDYTIAVIMGMGSVLLVHSIINNNWNMFSAMIVGMILGTAVLLLSVLLFTPVATAFELFPVGMIITMFTGMGTGMAITMTEIDLRSMLIAAVVFSLLSQLAIDLYNRKLKGDVPYDGKS
ncbi:MAG: hypothetical protein JSU99_06260 [Nitrospiraceae bacterium]|nr:MAG: hypothetical protein JSU99_06260 [Nitrospiraceae bacterium]